LRNLLQGHGLTSALTITLDRQQFQQQGDSETLENNTSIDARPKQELLYNEIDRLMKAFKGQRCALDFDRGFVNSRLKEAEKANDDET
jgi:hypothetical protein